MIKLLSKQKNIAFIVGGIIITLLFVNFVIKPLVEKIATLSKQIKLAQAQLKEGLNIQSQKDTILEAYNRYQVYLKQENLSEREIVGNFLEELEKIAQQSRLSVLSLSPSDAESQNDIQIYNADFRAEGKMTQLLDFFNRVQKSRLLIDIKRLTMAPKDKNAIVLKLDAKISMTIP